MAVKSFFNRLKFWKRNIGHGESFTNVESTPEYRLANKLKRYEKYVSQIQSIIMWDNPAVSVLWVLLVNFIFWVFVSLEWRFYGILSSILFVVMVHEAWTGHIWPEISVEGSQQPPSDNSPANTSVVAVSRMVTSVCVWLRQGAAWLANLRTHHPGLFCVVASLVCTTLLVLGRTVSGLLLVYCLVMSALLAPGLLVKFVPSQFKATFAQYATCVQQAFNKYSAGDTSDDEYIPVTTSEDLALLTRASDLHNDTYDSLTNPGSSSEMVSGMGLMPSHEEDSMGTLSDLEPCVSQLPLDPADDSDSNPGEHQIQFQSGHFNGDSSSDEEPFARDLVFSKADERDSIPHRGLSGLIAQAVSSNVLGSVNLLANVIRQRPPPTRRTDTDSDIEDFEIINRDELSGQDS